VNKIVQYDINGFSLGQKVLNYVDLKAYLYKSKFSWSFTQRAKDEFTARQGIEETIPVGPLFQHQAEAVAFLKWKGGNGIISFESGLGKTLIALQWLSDEKKKALIVCPKIAIKSWKDDALKFYGESTHEIINYEKIHKIEDFSPFDALVIDESHLIKNPSTKRATQILAIKDKFKHIILLSGTGLKNSPKDLYGQMALFNCPKGLDFYQGNKEKIYTYLTSNLVFQKTRADLDIMLPPKNLEVINADIPDFGKGISGRVKTATAKIDYTVKKANFLLRSTKENILILSESIPVAKTLAKKLSATLYTGNSKPEVLENWQEGKTNCRVLVSTRQSLSVGFNLQRASRVIWNDLPWTFADLIQGENRVYRLNTKNEVFIYYVLSTNDFDKNVISLLAEKKRLHQLFCCGKNDYKESNDFRNFVGNK